MTRKGDHTSLVVCAFFAYATQHSTISGKKQARGVLAKAEKIKKIK